MKAESLRFKEDGVLAVLKEVFTPWYNDYRFLFQIFSSLSRRRVHLDRGELWEV